MAAYYNENDPYCDQWLRNLIAAGRIERGTVDERSAEEVRPADLEGYRRVHLFAGIGGWDYALRLAGWPDSAPVWTGSCPCQPFSVAGKRKGTDDPRHLWPRFRELISACRPPVVFGEQVASRAGREWLAGVRADLESLGYEVGAADLCAACVGAPHIRQRLYWVAESYDAERRADLAGRNQRNRKGQGRPEAYGKSRTGNATGVKRLEKPGYKRGTGLLHNSRSGSASKEIWKRDAPIGPGGTDARRMGDAAYSGLQGKWREYRPHGEGCSGFVGFAVQADVPEWNGSAIAVKCSDGARRVSAEPGAFPLAHGIPSRVGKLRAYGNAIVPQLAAVFIRAYMQDRGIA